MRQAEAHESVKNKLEKFKRAQKKKGEWQQAQETLQQMKAIEDKDYESLETLHNQCSQLEASLKASKLALTFSANKTTRLKVAKDFEKETTHELKQGESVELAAGGQIQIWHDDWTLKVKSGEIDFDDLLSSFNEVSKEYSVY